MLTFSDVSPVSHISRSCGTLLLWYCLLEIVRCTESADHKLAAKTIHSVFSHGSVLAPVAVCFVLLLIIPLVLAIVLLPVDSHFSPPV
uniref:Uncharacterized protein n=1 Tax=Arundo donax TaxID=35708 RepID=A0A0A9C2A8_ARUDO